MGRVYKADASDDESRGRSESPRRRNWCGTDRARVAVPPRSPSRRPAHAIRTSSWLSTPTRSRAGIISPWNSSRPNLERYVKKHGSLPIGLACEIIFQTANGLQLRLRKRNDASRHQAGQPASTSGSRSRHDPGETPRFRPRPLRPQDADAARRSLPSENTVMGTPDFLSPEQSLDLHEADIRSDLYSLGCTFRFSACRPAPFPGGNTGRQADPPSQRSPPGDSPNPPRLAGGDRDYRAQTDGEESGRIAFRRRTN